MFDIGWTELLVIGIVALIVVGPKDLPGMFKALGQFTGRMRRMAREFQQAMEDAADESGVKGVQSDFRKMTSARSLGLDAVKDAADKFDKWDPAKTPRAAAPKGDEAVEAPRDDGAARPRGPETQRLAEERRARRQTIREDVERRAADKAEAAGAPRDETIGEAAREAGRDT